ncbi:superoxide dismutase [Malassezia vespertilionis]|uniref:Superoxide dismutase n=1 Tax=Malassezia vespertilionis TaxID=2020962 RepID=A0A2N1JAZ7_9BASI|nr:superoxide dismutase [Malassezia vespertilionis]PKI83738.1 hypothetical protein MVES_002309 [Malassezia vespertilionis]WFD07090.1 superoxide dismutase [Malassezia vespertilionis]
MFAFATRRAATSLKPAVHMSVRTKYTLPPLDYDYGALEPAISGEIMEVHYNKHHQTYVNNLNAAEEALDKVRQSNNMENLKSEVGLLKAINFNGGGNLNHTLFWKNLAPPNKGGGQLEGGVLRAAIERDFGGVDQFKNKFNATLAGIQGSGWGWLVLDPTSKQLQIVATANQDPVVNQVPLIGIDAWEHAFYLQYKNDKASYFKNIWNVINFEEAEKRLKAAK